MFERGGRGRTLKKIIYFNIKGFISIIFFKYMLNLAGVIVNVSTLTKRHKVHTLHKPRSIYHAKIIRQWEEGLK